MAREIYVHIFGIFLVLVSIFPLWASYKAGEVSWNWSDILEFFTLNKPKPKSKTPPEHP